ncbi:MAG TPA: NAD(P)/FAD-dependent oxidoreductase [Terriglobales bacterium]|nr:NAD(P)/FAD-dependent oxidoreductase [Terriglobales bacterium]
MKAFPVSKQLPRVVIVGGGFGGLYAAKGLARAAVRVTVIDRHNYHLFRPMLYQVATGLLSSDQVAAPLRSILRQQENVEVLLAEVTGVDTAAKLVQTDQGCISYDFLILATGIHYNYFGHDEWKQVAPGLDTVDDADEIRGKILLAFEEAESIAARTEADSDSVRDLLTFVIVGGGTAGVEMAGTMAEMTRLALARDFRHIDPRSARILLYEAGARILPTYPEHLSRKSRQHLEALGVQVHVNAKVEKVDGDGVIVAGTRIRSRTVIWSAGVAASPAGQWLSAETDRSGRVKVGEDLSLPGHPDVFVIGDTALVRAHTRDMLGRRSREKVALAGVAQPAIQEGKYVAKLIRARVVGKQALAPFWYWDKGSMAIVGRTYAIADLNFVRFAGFLAWLTWAGVHIYFLIGFANRLLVMFQWGVSFLTKRRAVRIFPSDLHMSVPIRDLCSESELNRSTVDEPRAHPRLGVKNRPAASGRREIQPTPPAAALGEHPNRRIPIEFR